MIFSVTLPGGVRFRMVRREPAVMMVKQGDIHYIGGTEVLPPPLETEEENEMLLQLGGEEDSRARAILIEHNLRLVVYIAKRFDNTGVGVEDLISIGTIGLIKAISTYKEAYGSRLATYAVRCIDNELLMHFRAKKKTSREMSLYEPIGTDKEGNQIQLVDVIISEEVDVVDLMERNQKAEKLTQIISEVLSGRELFIIINRYGLFHKEAMTQREIADKLGISRSYVSRIEKKALEKLKKAF